MLSKKILRSVRYFQHAANIITISVIFYNSGWHGDTGIGFKCQLCRHTDLFNTFY